ncbi:MAG: hypothetical protein ABJE95_11185 [Byssovorax sp.]
MTEGIEEPIEGVTLERYAAIVARLDVEAPASPSGAPPPTRARNDVLRAEGVDPAIWSKVHGGFQEQIREEIRRASTATHVPMLERYAVVTRYGAAYAKAKRGLEEKRPKASRARIAKQDP